ncbi:MAG: Maf family protein [Deltaproteobacteria bacterium]|nr:Maf family protein [Deltaproteobacteria bacterium]
MDTKKRPSPFQTTAPLILASGSPRRQDFLRTLGLKFEVVVSHVEEAPFLDGDPARYALEMAEAKARAVSCSHPRSWVVAADTIVIIGHEVLGKPKTEKEAISMLGRLSGRWHEVISAFCLLHHEKGAAYKKAVQSRVKIKRLTAAEVTSYVVTGEPMDKAGAYAVQGIGAFMVEKIEGSYTNVVGLPLSELIGAMQAVDIIRPRVAGSD